VEVKTTSVQGDEVANKLTYLQQDPTVGSQFTTAVSLHGHTNRSRESLYFISEFANRRGLLRWALSKQDRKAQRESGIRMDLWKAYWTPPLAPLEAFQVERKQIEDTLGMQSLISLTDHDSIEAPLLLRVVPEARRIPVSLEWSIPFEQTVFHLGVHNLPTAEAETWVRAAANMYVPHDEKLRIIPQDDNFLAKEPWDFRNTPSDHYPLLLFYHPLNIYRKQVIKQADVILAMFLLGDVFPPETKKRNFDFYDPLTTGDSSLSSCVEAIIAAQTGDTEKAIRYGMAALLMDLGDVGGNVKDGCHIASMGGTWMMLAYGLGGMRDNDGTLSFWPRRAPQDNGILRFRVTYRGQMLEIEIRPENVEYALREGESLLIRHEREEVRLTGQHPAAVRPVSRAV